MSDFDDNFDFDNNLAALQDKVRDVLHSFGQIDSSDTLVEFIALDLLLQYDDFQLDTDIITKRVQTELQFERSFHADSGAINDADLEEDIDLDEETSDEDGTISAAHKIQVAVAETKEIDINDPTLIRFLLSDSVIPFLPILSQRQRSLVGQFRTIATDNIPSTTNVFETKNEQLLFNYALNHITSYLQFLISNEHLLETDSENLYTLRTMPYFWREQKRETDRRIQSTPSESGHNRLLLEFIQFRTRQVLAEIYQGSPQDMRAFELKDLYRLTNEKIGVLLGMTESTIQRRIANARKLAQDKISIEDEVITFLSMQPRVRYALTLHNRGQNINQIAESLNTTASAIYIALNRANTITLNTNRTGPKSRLANSIEDIRLNWELYSFNENSNYRDAIRRIILEEKRPDLAALYFHLQRTPNRELLAIKLGYAPLSLKNLIGELKSLLLPEDHPARNSRSYEDWVEVTSEGRIHLLKDKEIQVMQLIKAGKTQREIADIIGVAKGSAQNLIENVRKIYGEDVSAYPNIEQ